MTETGPILLAIARAAISRALHIPRIADESAPWLTEYGACFVTLTQHGQLRGCIGSLIPHRSLLADLKSNAIAAALQDPRFMPLTADELDTTRIEISLLSPIEKMAFRDKADALSQLRPGINGVIFEYGRYRSTFLPQVWEQLPQPALFLSQLKRKAGLPEDFWDQGVQLSRYSVSKFKEA